jgi:hypothetical protein
LTTVCSNSKGLLSFIDRLILYRLIQTMGALGYLKFSSCF